MTLTTISPAAPHLASCHPDDEMRSGFHIARRHEWPGARLEVVYLDVWSDSRGYQFALHRCGTGRVEDPFEWEFRHRVVGLDSPCREAIDLDAVEISAVRH